MISKIMLPVGIAGGPQCVSNFLHSVLLKSSEKQKNITTQKQNIIQTQLMPFLFFSLGNEN